MTLSTGAGLVLLAFVLAAAGGAIAGTRIAGDYLGKELAAMMGAVFGPCSVVPAMVVGLALIALFS